MAGPALLVAVLIGVTLLEPTLATWAVFPLGETRTACGILPTSIWAVTRSVAVAMARDGPGTVVGHIGRPAVGGNGDGYGVLAHGDGRAGCGGSRRDRGHGPRGAVDE